jgi:hypothetical protein
MPRASSVLCLPALLGLAAAANAVEPPVITNGVQLAQAPKAGDQPAAAKGQLPVIVNYTAAFKGEPPPADGKGPKIINESPAAKPGNAPARVAYAYTYPYVGEYMSPVAYNAYGYGPMLGLNAAYGYGQGYDMMAPYAGGFGYGGYGYAAAYGGLGFAPAVYDWRPPRVEVLDTGIRANVGRLTSMPPVREPVWGDVIAVYYR